jgi:hypothetical protein
MLGASAYLMGIVWVVGVSVILVIIAKLIVPRKKT